MDLIEKCKELYPVDIVSIYENIRNIAIKEDDVIEIVQEEAMARGFTEQQAHDFIFGAQRLNDLMDELGYKIKGILNYPIVMD